MKTYSNWWLFKLRDENEGCVSLTYSLPSLVKVMVIIVVFVPVILITLGLIEVTLSFIAYLIISPLLIIFLLCWKQIDVLKIEGMKFIVNSNQMNLDLGDVSHLFVRSEINKRADTSDTVVQCVLKSGHSIDLFKVLDVGVGLALKDFGEKVGLDFRYEQKSSYHGQLNSQN